MARTITSGIVSTTGTAVFPIGSITWTDLDSSPYSTWENWTSWTESASDIQVSETITAATNDFYVPVARVETEGTLTITVDVSDTGLFTGEESTMTFATDDVGQTLIKGKYFRWNFTVAATAEEPIPYLAYIVSANNSLVDVYLDDVSVPALPTDSLGFRLVDHPLGAVKNVQATTLQGEDYVDTGYVLTFAGLDSYVRTSADSLITQEGAPYDYVDSFAPRMGKAIQWNGVDQALEIDNSGGEIMSGYPWTIEFFFKVPPGLVDPNYGAERTLFAAWGASDSQYAILVRVKEGDSADPKSYVTFQLRTGGGIIHTPFPIDANRWYHYVLTMTNSTTYRSTIATVDRLDSGTDLGEGPQDVETGTVPVAQPEIDVIYIGKSNAPVNPDYYTDFTDVEMEDLHITNSVRYSTYTSSTVPQVPYTSTENTTLLLHFNDSVADDNLVRTGTEDYTFRQNGGSAVVETKNPLAIKVVDYNGDAWDGAVDLHLRGLPKVAKLGNSLTIKYD